MYSLETMGKNARSASMLLAYADTRLKNSALKAISENIRKNSGRIIEANRLDIDLAVKNKKDSAFLDRLRLDEERIEKTALSTLDVMALPDPVGDTIKKWKRPNALEIEKVRVPIGVIGIIYEARPDVSVEASALCLKSGNCVILRGGSDAYNSNLMLVSIIKQSLADAGLPSGCVQMLEDTSRGSVIKLLKMNLYIDLVIPRGGRGLIEMVSENSRIAVIKHYKGVCHVYVDASADQEMARSICLNAKLQRPSVCNAMETLLVHEELNPGFLLPMLEEFREAGVKIKGDEKVLKTAPWAEKASEEDWEEEYLGLTLAVRVVASLDEAVSHINTYGSSHSDAIITKDYESSRKFLKMVDSSAVYVNASTRFTDGGEFGFGAEMGISTDKLHARGPMALEELTSYKYLVYGSGQIRE